MTVHTGSMPAEDLLPNAKFRLTGEVRLALPAVRVLMLQVMFSLLVTLERRDMCTGSGVKDVL